MLAKKFEGILCTRPKILILRDFHDETKSADKTQVFTAQDLKFDCASLVYTKGHKDFLNGLGFPVDLSDVRTYCLVNERCIGKFLEQDARE